MLNKKVIVVNGLAHGGTNVLWNIISSHPDVALPGYETGEILRNHRFIWRLIPQWSGPSWLSRHIAWRLADRCFFRLKMRSLASDHKYREEDLKYTDSQLATTALCLKSVYNEIALTDELRRVYPNSYFVGLVRNGYAFCEGNVRRGMMATKAGELYHRYVSMLIEQRSRIDRYEILKFEDILQDPFGISEHLYRFLNLQPCQLSKLRLKAKQTLHEDGSHEVQFGQHNEHYWFDRQTIKNAIVPNIDTIQADKLSDDDRRKFEAYALPELRAFGYC